MIRFRSSERRPSLSVALPFAQPDVRSILGHDSAIGRDAVRAGRAFSPRAIGRSRSSSTRFLDLLRSTRRGRTLCASSPMSCSRSSSSCRRFPGSPILAPRHQRLPRVALRRGGMDSQPSPRSSRPLRAQAARPPKRARSAVTYLSRAVRHSMRFGAADLAQFEELLVFSSCCEERRRSANRLAAEDEQLAERPDYPLSGLHTKLFVSEFDHSARLWTGSANATNAAFSGNVEFLVELQGARSACGVDAVLEGRTGGVKLRDLLETYRAPRAGRCRNRSATARAATRRSTPRHRCTWLRGGRRGTRRRCGREVYALRVRVIRNETLPACAE